jgi:hypothetical protein
VASNKRWTAKFYDQTGASPGFLKNISTGKPLDSSPFLKSVPSFPSQINGGLGQCVLDIAYPFDDFGTEIDFMHIVDIWCYDQANPRGRRIYRGFISRFEVYVEGGNEGVRVTLLGLVSILPFGYYKDGTGYTVIHTAEDPETIARAIVDHVNSIYSGSLLSYSGASTDPVGTTVSITFIDQFWNNAIATTQQVAGTGWWWSIDCDGLFWLKAKPLAATHMFTFGKDIDSLTIPKTAEKIVNDVQVRYNGGSYDYNDPTSESEFGTGSPATGKRSEIITATDLDLAGAQQRGQKRVNDEKDAKIAGSIVVNDTYDLESIRVGQTANIRNLRKGNTFFPDNLQIVAINYEGFQATVDLGEQGANFGLELADFVAS